MLPHQERVIAEQAELNTKLNSLSIFMAGNSYNTLNSDERDLLRKQQRAMEEYSRILNQRIAAFR